MSDERPDAGLPDVWIVQPSGDRHATQVDMSAYPNWHHYTPAARVQRMIDENAKVAGLVEALEWIAKPEILINDPEMLRQIRLCATKALAAYHEGRVVPAGKDE